MIEGLMIWWRGRTARERGLLAVLAILAVPMLLWYGVGRPFGLLLDHDRMRRDEAGRMLGDVRAMAAELGTLDGRHVQPLAGPLPRAVRSAAEAAGFTVSRVDPTSGEGVVLVLDAVRAQPFFTWLATVEQRRGLVVERLTAHPNSDSTLAISVTLRRRAK
jgi:general secretion pathway protein M